MIGRRVRSVVLFSIVRLLLLLLLPLVACWTADQPSTASAGGIIHSSSSSSRRDALALITSSAATSVLITTPSSAVASSAVPTSGIVMLPTNTDKDNKKMIPFPLASFGLQIYSDETAYKLTLTALEVGYRNFFSSCLTGNQRGFARAIKDSGLPRQDLFICGSVVSNRASGFNAAYQKTAIGCQQNMEKFAAGNIEYIDQIMLDYPGPDCASITGQWKAFQEMHQQGLTRTLSVSNFSPTQLDCLLKDSNTVIKPCVNQMPYSVAYHQPSNIIAEHEKRNILVQAWAPLGGSLGGRFDAKIKQRCRDIGKKYNKSFAQVALRWIVQTGAAFTTQSTNRDHFAEDLNIFDFELTAEEMATLSSLA